MKQSKGNSLIEAISNTAAGFIISFLLCYFILPIWGIKKSVISSLEITAIFTTASIARNYIIRRIFNKKVEKKEKP